jgi:hypothetical protein
MSRLPYFLENRFTDGGEVVRITHRPPFTFQEEPWNSFLSEGESTPGAIVRLEGLDQLKNPMTSRTEPATLRLVA